MIYKKQYGRSNRLERDQNLSENSRLHSVAEPEPPFFSPLLPLFLEGKIKFFDYFLLNK